MAQVSAKTERVMYELKPRPATVISINDLTPGYRQMVVTGDEFFDFQSQSPADHIKVQIEVDGEKIRRDYTPRRFENGELTLEFALHADGPVTNWARNAEVGSTCTVLGPRGSKVVKPVFDAYVIIGDETMLPTVGRALEMIDPDASIVAVIEVESEADRIELPTTGNRTVVWAERNGRTTGDALMEALSSIEWPGGDVYVHAGGEATAMRDVRRHVLNERELDREHLNISGHWKRGESDFDHHAPIEE